MWEFRIPDSKERSRGQGEGERVVSGNPEVPCSIPLTAGFPRDRDGRLRSCQGIPAAA